MMNTFRNTLSSFLAAKLMLLWHELIVPMLRLFGSISLMSLVTLLKSKDLFNRVLSDTNRSYSMAWGKCLPSISPQELTKNHRPINLMINREKITLGLIELIPILEIVKLSGAKNILEIGTSSGGTTWHLAANAGADASITTVDLPPTASKVMRYSSNQLATERPTENQLRRFFRGTQEEQCIKQVFIDSKNLLEELVGEEFELIFIDGAHTHEYVKNDTEKALKLIKHGGYIIWHDYFVFHHRYGVMRYLHELNKELPVYRLCNSLCGVCCFNGTK